MPSTAVSRVTDSPARTQLGGFENRPSSLAFGPAGCLAIGTSNGDVYFYREGGNRCTNTTPASPAAAIQQGAIPIARNRRNNVMVDGAGRLIAFDGHGLRVWQVRPAPSPPLAFAPLPPPSSPPGPGPGGGEPPTLFAHTPTDGRHVALTRSSEIYLWTTDHPDHPPRAVSWPRIRSNPPPEIVSSSPASSTDTEARPSPKAEPRGRQAGPSRERPVPQHCRNPDFSQRRSALCSDRDGRKARPVRRAQPRFPGGCRAGQGPSRRDPETARR